jgi:hypothetical protein
VAILESLDKPGTSVVLAARHLVGRSKVCLLHIDDRQISGEHASLEWKGGGWEVRDLGSRNGTYVDGKQLAAGARAPLARGNEVHFARTSRWKLIDDSEPVAMAVPLADSSTGPAGSAAGTVTAEDGILALPRDSESPEVCIYQDSVGRWIAERHDREDLIRDCDYVMAGGSAFRVHLPGAVATTSSLDETPCIGELGLHFAVSSDEEYVELRVRHRKRQWTLESRTHHYPLLILARARVRDRQESGLPASAHGWIYQDELVEMLDCSPNRLHTDIYRARRQLAALGIAGAAAVVERRATTKQLRLGIEDIDIETI